MSPSSSVANSRQWQQSTFKESGVPSYLVKLLFAILVSNSYVKSFLFDVFSLNKCVMIKLILQLLLKFCYCLSYDVRIYGVLSLELWFEHTQLCENSSIKMVVMYFDHGFGKGGFQIEQRLLIPQSFLFFAIPGEAIRYRCSYQEGVLDLIRFSQVVCVSFLVK